MILIPVFVLAAAEWAAQTFDKRRGNTYYDDQTELALGKPVPEKKPGEYRVFLYGGSSAYGFPVADRYSITAWLRKSFPHLLPGKTVNVMNCAWPGKASHHDLEGVHAVLKYKPDLFIIYTGHNEAPVDNRLFVDHWIYKLDLRLKFRSAFYRFLLTRFHKARKFIVYGSSGYTEKQYREEIIANKVYKKVEVDDEEYGKILQAYRKNIESIIRFAKEHQIRVLIVNLPSNLRDIPPAISTHKAALSEVKLADWNRYFEEAKAFEKQGKYKEAVESYQVAAAIDPTYADLQYQLGQSYEQIGDYASAKKAYQSALDHDGHPWRAKSSLNEILLQISQQQDIIFVDIVAALERLSPHGILSRELIYDNVHPSIQAQQVITDEILHALAQANWLAPAGEWQWKALEKAKEDKTSEDWKVDGSLNAYTYVLRGLNLWEEKRYDMAAVDLEKGLELMPKFVESYAFLGDSYLRLGEFEKAAKAFQTLTQKDPSLSDYLAKKYPDIEESFNKSMIKAAQSQKL